MTEYDILCSILNRHFLAQSQDIMIETKGRIKPQRVTIDGSGRNNLTWTLYKFEMDDCNFLPFFANQDGAPEGLCKFCDYVLIVEASLKTYVMLIEMKRGQSNEAEKQLYASETFMNYVFATANRLHKDFDSAQFNSSGVILRKIKLKQNISPKITTKMYNVDLRQNYIPYESYGIFPIAQFLNR